MIQQLAFASISVCVIVFLLFLGNFVTSPFTMPGAIPIATILAFIILGIFIYLANVTEGK